MSYSVKTFLTVSLCLVVAGLLPGSAIAERVGTVTVGGYTFDPLDREFAVPDDMTVSYKDGDTGYYLVQFNDLPIDAAVSF